MPYDPETAKRDVLKLYSAIMVQAVKDYRLGDRYQRREIVKFFNSEWGRSILDVLGLDHDEVVRKLKTEVAQQWPERKHAVQRQDKPGNRETGSGSGKAK